LTAAAAASETALPVVASLPVSEKMVISLIGDPGQDAADPLCAEPPAADTLPPEEPQPASRTAADNPRNSPVLAFLERAAKAPRTPSKNPGPNVLTDWLSSAGFA
jgi:hypothetical protein